MRVRGEVLDEKKLPLHDGSFIDRTGKVGDAILRRISTDSAVSKLSPGMQHEDLSALNRGKTK